MNRWSFINSSWRQADFWQIIAEVEAAKKTLLELKQVVEQAKEKQKAAQAEVKRLEKEMADFKNNKDSKLNEIKVSCLLISRILFR